MPLDAEGADVDSQKEVEAATSQSCIASDDDIYLRAAEDTALLDELSNQADVNDFVDLQGTRSVHDNQDISESESKDGDAFAGSAIVCDFAPNMEFTFCRRSSNVVTENTSQKHKIRQLRLVDGRLQVVGFPDNVPELQKSRRPPRLKRKDSRYSSQFWSEVISFLMH
jgi:hypothetical protein